MVFCNSTTLYLLNAPAGCHNPYFNRWFSAIEPMSDNDTIVNVVTILILIDGFLQFVYKLCLLCVVFSHNPYFNRWFSAIDIDEKYHCDFDLSQSLF